MRGWRPYHWLALLAIILIIGGCTREWREWSYGYINGTIGGVPHNKSGYVSVQIANGETVLSAADSSADILADTDYWLIFFPATAAGTYSSQDRAKAVFTVSSSERYVSDLDIIIVVSAYTSEGVKGTFSGTLVNSADLLEYEVTGEFDLQI
jgi:hypothetical protein